MISITHYEVYTDRGNGWKLEERFGNEQRYDAINLAKEKENEKLKVKVIKEVFDVQDNSYQETVEYVSNLGGINKKDTGSKQSVEPASPYEVQNSTVAQKISTTGIFKALLRLIVIIILCLVFANLLITLLVPLIKDSVPEEVLRPILFSSFFILFLSITIPLVLKKVPWHVFADKKQKAPIVNERKFLNHAESIYELYSLNDDFDVNITPVFPEAPFEYKQYIVSFLRMLLSQLDSKTSFSDSFSRLGIKLMVYGGCIELSRNCGLRISEANSLLYEAFKVLEGDKVDLVAFYEAKRTYKDNKNAVFLCGIGAYLMTRIMNGQPFDEEVLHVGFKKWEALNSNLSDESQKATYAEKEILFSSIVNIKSNLHFTEEDTENADVSAKISNDIHNIVQNLLNKYAGENLVEENGISTISFRLLNEAVKFAIAFVKDISLYQDEVNNDKLVLKNMCAITESNGKLPYNYIDGIFEHAYDGEIIITSGIMQKLSPQDYPTEFLGEKKITNTETSEEIYKLFF